MKTPQLSQGLAPQALRSQQEIAHAYFAILELIDDL